MADRFDLKAFLLSPEGRVGPSPFFSFMAIVAMYSAILNFSLGMTGTSELLALFILLITILTAWSRYCVTVKRLRDAGWPLQWAFVQFAPDLLAMLTLALGISWLALATRLATLALLVLVFGLIITPGVRGEDSGPTPPPAGS